MVSVSNFPNMMDFVPVSTAKQENTSKGYGKNDSKSNFKDVLDNTVQLKTQEKPDNVDRSYKTEKKEQEKALDDISIEIKSNDSVKEKVQISNEEITAEQTVTLSDLSNEDKAFIKELAQMLGIDEETFLQLLSVLNIGLTELQQEMTLDKASIKIKEVLNNAIEKIKIDINIKEPSIKEKIHIMLLHKEVSNQNLAEQVIQQNNSLGNSEIKQDRENEIEVLKTNEIKSAEQSESFNDGIPQVKIQNTEQSTEQGIQQSKEQNIHYQVKNINTNANTQPQPNKEDLKVTQDTVSLKIDTVQKQTSEESTSNQNGKNGDSLDTTEQQPFIKNLKVVNLQTSKEAETLNQDMMNLFQSQQVETNNNKVIFVKNPLNSPNNQKMDIFNQIVETAKLVLTDKQTEMELTLKPESLGKLSLKIATENGMVVAKITTESQRVKEVIETNLLELKESLKQQGLNIQGFSVSVGHESRQFLNERFTGSKATKVKVNNINVVEVSENYLQRQVARNPYLFSESNIDYTA